MNGLIVGCPPRSICTSSPSRRRLIVAQTPISGPSPSMSSGTSSAMELTLLSAKSSCPVHWKPCRAPSTSAKNGSLRSPADSRIGPAWTGRAVPSKLTGIDSASTSPTGPGWRAWATGGVPGGPGLHAVVERGEGEGERDVGLQVAVGVDVDPVDRVGVEFRAGRGRRYGGRGARRVRVDDQHRLTGLVTVQQPVVMLAPGCREDEQVGQVQAPVVAGKLEIVSAEMVGHGGSFGGDCLDGGVVTDPQVRRKSSRAVFT